MNTGSFSNWDGNMFDLGPIYPFVGWEVPMVVLAVIFIVGWQVLQVRMENRKLEEEARMLRQDGNLLKALQAEHAPERM